MKTFICALQNYTGIIFIYISNVVFEILFINKILNADVIEKNILNKILIDTKYTCHKRNIIKHVFFILIFHRLNRTHTYRFIFPTILRYTNHCYMKIYYLILYR